MTREGRHGVPMRRLFALVLVLAAACGVPQEEHDKALADQKAAYDAEMKKAQMDHDKVVQSKVGHIGNLETEVKRLGGDLAEITAQAEKLDEKLGVKAIELETAKQQVEETGKQLVETGKKLEATETELEQVRKLRAQAEMAAKAFKDLAVKLKSMVDSGQLEVVMREGKMMLKLPDDILFASGKTKLKKAGREALLQVAEVLKTVAGRDFLIAGHTDNVPMKRGKFKSNWDLSTARAVEVVKLMVAAGVDGARLGGAGFGEFDPVADNETKEGRAKNRRLEIILMPNIDELPQIPTE